MIFCFTLSARTFVARIGVQHALNLIELHQYQVLNAVRYLVLALHCLFRVSPVQLS
jgi:hypothetical protein